MHETGAFAGGGNYPYKAELAVTLSVRLDEGRSRDLPHRCRLVQPGGTNPFETRRKTLGKLRVFRLAQRLRLGTPMISATSERTAATSVPVVSRHSFRGQPENSRPGEKRGPKPAS